MQKLNERGIYNLQDLQITVCTTSKMSYWTSSTIFYFTTILQSKIPKYIKNAFTDWITKQETKRFI
jgi:hypothetical protein